MKIGIYTNALNNQLAFREEILELLQIVLWKCQLTAQLWSKTSRIVRSFGKGIEKKMKNIIMLLYESMMFWCLESCVHFWSAHVKNWGGDTETFNARGDVAEQNSFRL